MLFGAELDRRLRAAGSTTLSVVNHPGGALDSRTPPRPPMWGPRMLGLSGQPRLETVHGQLADTAVAAKMWATSVELTGVDPGCGLG